MKEQEQGAALDRLGSSTGILKLKGKSQQRLWSRKIEGLHRECKNKVVLDIVISRATSSLLDRRAPLF